MTPLGERSELLRLDESEPRVERFEELPDSLPRLERVEDPDRDWFDGLERLEPRTSGERVLPCELVLGCDVLRRELVLGCDDDRFGLTEFDRGAAEFRLPE